MASHALDVKKFERLAARQKLKNRQEIAAASGVQLRTLSKAFNGGHLSVDTLMKLSNAVGLGSDYEELILWPSHSRFGESSSDGEEITPTVLEGTSPLGEQQDIKLLLTSRDMSQSLLAARASVSFAECLKATKVWTPIDDAHKDHPIIPGLAYNHFVQPSIVLTLDINEPASIIGYSRVRRPLQPSNAHTAGMSILIAGSPIWGVTRHKKSALDHWLASTHNPKRATAELLGGVAPAILQFVNYKIDLLRYECRILPLGVITKDERRKPHRRVYTQFVFHVRLKVKAKNLDDFVGHLPTRGLFPYRLSRSIDPGKIFVGTVCQMNVMDVVAWRALHGKSAMLQCGPAKFRRDFRIA
jgi:hypothetical protein